MLLLPFPDSILRCRMASIINLVGKRVNKLTVVAFFGRTENYHYMWKCKCECGGEAIVDGSDLRSGRAKGCGCLIGKQNTTHGKSKTKTYNVWFGMRKRCHDPQDPAYKNYGARGVSVCDEWLSSFDAFYRDMGDPPEGKTLDRINNDLGYSKENCRWIGMAEQMNNKRNNRVLTAFGMSLTVSEWSKKIGVRSGTIRQRIDYYGWDVERALQG